jgi:carboxylesterase type B
MPGNYALWDAHQALTWVKDNIELFGGAPSTVTIFGQSAGGAMTSHSLISPRLNGLIHRGIAVSGTSTGFFGVGDRNNTAASTFELANWLLCRRADTSEVN